VTHQKQELVLELEQVQEQVQERVLVLDLEKERLNHPLRMRPGRRRHQNLEDYSKDRY
jgi:hypothetical protein